MAHLEVEPKPSRPWWVWLLIVLLIILLVGLLMSKCNNESTTADADITDADIQTSSSGTYTNETKAGRKQNCNVAIVVFLKQ